VRRTLGRSLRFVELADAVNTGMPEHVVGRLESLLNDSARALRGAAVLVVGLASHPDGGDVRASPAVRVCELLAAKGAVVMAVDPNVADRDWPDGVARVELDAATAAAADVAVVLTLHGDVDPAPLRDCLVLDTRNVVRNGTAVLL
jgi:UDP-N-acetyl-D-mannosaminuronate dehydrogenase